MTGQDCGGPAAPKLARLLCFVGAALVVTVGTNKWREIERRSTVQGELRQQDSKNPVPIPSAAVK